MSKHLFRPSSTNLCKKCNKGKSHNRHLKPSFPLMFNWLFDEKWIYFEPSKFFKKTRTKCLKCGTTKLKLTKHHLKNMNGKKNGKIQKLCRPCHNLAEEEYAKLGIIKPTSK